MKLMNALNLFFHCGLLFDKPFPAIHDLPISDDTIDTIYTKVEAPDHEWEGSSQEKTVKNETKNNNTTN